MNKVVHLYHQDWFIPVLFLGLTIWLVFVFKEFYNAKNGRLINCIVSLFLVTALCAVILKPGIRSSLKTKNVIVLTEDFNQNHLDSLRKINRKIEIINYKNNEALSFKVEPDTIFVLGNGVEAYDLWQLENRTVSFLYDGKLRGIEKFKYIPETSLGKDIIFAGVYSNPKKGNKLILNNEVGVPLDSVELNSAESQIFKFSARPKVSGRFLYTITEMDSMKKIINSDPIPIIIKKPKKLNILMLNSYPNFESRYLKNYLAESGHQITVRNRISRGKFKYEFLNKERIPFFNINDRILKSTDLIIIDEQEFQNLGKTDRDLIKKEITENGLGIFIQQDDNFYYNSGLLEKFAYEYDSATKSEILLNSKVQNISKAQRIFKTENVVQLISNTKNETVAAYYRIEKGSVGSSLLKDTYALQLKGDEESYQQLWSYIIEKIAKKSQKSVSFAAQHFIAYKDEPFHISVTMNTFNELQSDQGYYIPLRNNKVLKEEWDGIYYPKHKGWEKIFIKNDSTFSTSIYVSDKSNWKVLRTKAKVWANRRWISSMKKDSSDSRSIKPINLFWLYAVILLCFGYLWLIPKIRD